MDVFEELDKSGGDAGRPLWNRAIEMVERGDAGALVVWNLSRFSRSLPDALRAIERIEAAGGRLLSEEGATGKLGGVGGTVRLPGAQEARLHVLEVRSTLVRA